MEQQTTTKRWYNGNCHCGAVRFRAHLDIHSGTSKCNRTFCWKQRNWNVCGLKPDDFELRAGAGSPSTYTLICTRADVIASWDRVGYSPLRSAVHPGVAVPIRES